MLHDWDGDVERALLEQLDRALSRYAATPYEQQHDIREMHLSAARLGQATYDRSAEPEYVRALTAFSAFVLRRETAPGRAPHEAA